MFCERNFNGQLLTKLKNKTIVERRVAAAKTISLFIHTNPMALSRKSTN